jgi:hypothetical protein
MTSLRADAGPERGALRVKTVILAKSAGRKKARCSKGTRWIPLRPETAERFSVTTSGDPAYRIAGGTRSGRGLLDRDDGNVARADYNVGAGKRTIT